MPELPEVESVRQGLLEILGQTIQKVVLGPEHQLKSLVPPHSLDLQELQGMTVLSMQRRGKFLKIELSQGSLLIHLGMSGVLLWQAQPRPHTHIQLQLDHGWLRYSDPRRFGHWEFLPPGELFKSWENLGPDALDPDLSPSQLWQRTHRSQRSAKDLLLDQSLLAGIGNIYACEALFAAGVHPKRKGCELSLNDWENLCSHARRIMTLSIQNKGTTFSDYRLTNGKGGAFQGFLQVFQKEHHPCPQCQSPIQKLVQSSRASFYCPHCQH